MLYECEERGFDICFPRLPTFPLVPRQTGSKWYKHALAGIYMHRYIRDLGSSFVIIAEPNRRAILNASHIAAVGRRNRTSTADAAALRFQAPPGPARGWFCTVTGSSAAMSLPDWTKPAQGKRRLVGTISPLLGGPRRRSRTTS
jgi:hypothetical protein